MPGPRCAALLRFHLDIELEQVHHPAYRRRVIDAKRTLDRVPLLGDIPVIGNLFRSRGRSRSRTNLMVFIRATVIRTAEDAQAMSARRYNYVRGHQIIATPNREPTLDEVVRDYLGTTPPVAPDTPRPGDQVVAPPPSAPAPAEELTPQEAQAFRAQPQ